MTAFGNRKGMRGRRRVDMGEIRAIVNGGEDRRRLRFELSRARRLLRCPTGHSSGSGVRPVILPVARDVNYSIHGTSMVAEWRISEEGLRK